MPKLSSIIQYAAHPQELRAMIQWKLWHEPVHARDASEESANLKRCYHFLHMTSRSFAAVIRELHPELLVPVCVFYLVLRGLDTIEDDMTIDIKQKDELLRQFATRLEQPGWTFDGNGLDEDDRQLLVEFDCVITEFANVKSAYRVIIKDICQRMGDGMADFAWKGNDQDYRVESVQEYELYCHYVAGLVGEGLTRLFVEAKLADPALLGRKDLYESMGQMLQQTNIIRDVREDRDDKRYFWPREIWSRHVEDYEDLFKPENSEIAMQCQTEMILHAIRRGSDCLHYLSGLREQSVFNFCAIPQSMALATLDRCFRNKDMFQRNVKIRRGEACMLMMESTQNLRIVTNVFKRHVRSIHKKNSPTDPNFLAVSIACAKVCMILSDTWNQSDIQRSRLLSKACTLPQVVLPNQGRPQQRQTSAWRTSKRPRETWCTLVWLYSAHSPFSLFAWYVFLQV